MSIKCKRCGSTNLTPACTDRNVYKCRECDTLTTNSTTSNDTSQHKWVIQGFSPLDQTWQDSVHGGPTMEFALSKAEELRKLNALINSEIRVVRAKRQTRPTSADKILNWKNMISFYQSCDPGNHNPAVGLLIEGYKAQIELAESR